MNIMVCIKQVPATSRVEVDERTGVLKRDGAAAKINPYDLYALEAALRLREETDGSVDVITMGPPQAKTALLEALHIGADAGYLLTDRRFAGSDVLATARALSAGILACGRYDLILCGKQTTDGDTAQVGPELAELLGIEHASYVQRLTADSQAVVAEINTGEGMLVQRIPFPCLLTVEKDINTPRLPSYRRSLTMDEHRLAVRTLDDLSVDDPRLYGLLGSPTQVERIFPPEAQTGRVCWTGAAEQIAEQAYTLLAARKFI